MLGATNSMTKLFWQKPENIKHFKVKIHKDLFIYIIFKVNIHKLPGEQFLWNKNSNLGWFKSGWQ